MFGTEPEDRDEFMMFRKVVTGTGNSSLSSLVGMGSNEQVDGLEDTTILDSPPSVIGLKYSRVAKVAWCLCIMGVSNTYEWLIGEAAV